MGHGYRGAASSGKGGVKFAIVAVEYFTKWVEAEAVASITSESVKKFFWKNIVCRFGVPRELTLDNGGQFKSEEFQEYCQTLGTKTFFASVYHPQTNGAVERQNGCVFTAISRRLVGAKKGKWPDELLHVLWSHRTTPSRATGFSPFRLLFGAEAMTPEEIRWKSPRATANECEDEAATKDALEEDRLQAVANLKKYREETRAWKDKRVKSRSFVEGELVLKRRQGIVGKLQEKWEGPYIVSKANSNGAYHLTTMEGEEFGNTWNVEELRKFYV